MKSDSKATDRSSLEALTEAYLSRGGTITQCAPGPSENVTYKHSMRGRPRAKPDAAEKPQDSKDSAPATDA
ncbi:MAG TPA: hypothetical protein VD860_01195 [Azospirillum sp.]|nr:hypothetical protein [Azospirillum sp.]